MKGKIALSLQKINYQIYFSELYINEISVGVSTLWKNLMSSS